ncbi:DUF305 domain-containing protein [Sphingomonas lenta]|uniref:DUF305 domain-containing protein n=1 Tax=Sphingomonas lenta TaxID=1141887 RepID=UPI001595ABA1|nr:DUF305 domain-containing protein [Sphingomonas lenta]
MKTILPGTVAAAALLATAACSQGNSGANESTGGTEVTELKSENATASPGAMTPATQTPFTQAEMAMNERMMAASGATPADSWARKMIEHHRGAIAMSEIVLEQQPTPQVREMAQKTIEKQRKEIDELQKMTGEEAPASGQSAELYRPSMMQMHERMMAATGANPSETWTRKMIEHHQGGVEMSNVVLAQNPPEPVRDKAQKTKSDQQKEIAELQRMVQS